MATNYTAHGTVDKWDKREGKKIVYEFPTRNYSGAVLLVGLLIVAGIAAFIVKHWDTVSLCYC